MEGGHTSANDSAVRAVSDSVRGRRRGVEATVTWTTFVVVDGELKQGGRGKVSKGIDWQEEEMPVLPVLQT